MQYLLMIYSDETLWNSWDEATQMNVIDRYNSLVDELKQRGVFLGGERLMEVETASTVQVRDGKSIVTDGPFAETKEQLGGFFLVECKDIDEALEIAARIPTAEMGSIEVRPLWYQPE